MNEEVRTGRGRTLTIAAWVIVPMLLLVGLLVMLLRGSGTDRTTDNPDNKPRYQENLLATVRTTLARQTDLATCRTVVSELNTLLQRGEEHSVPALPAARLVELRKQLGLNAGEETELTSGSFTPLDAYHLESCFLLRDAARSLELAAPAGRGGKAIKQSPLERAVLAFDWVVREVRLPSSMLERAVLPAIDRNPVPPAFALRRGHGMALERALVFLSLLEQFGLEENASAGLQGCLLVLPGEKGQKRLWACGVVAAGEPDKLYLFDPRLGLALPGPGGKGVATLAQACRDKDVLGQVQAGKLRYDVTALQASNASAAVFAPLTALAPRMRLLQDRLLRDRAWQDQPLPPPVRVRLAEDDPGALEAVGRALESALGKAGAVRYWRPGAGILRNFVSKEEGGASPLVPFELRWLPGLTTEFDRSQPSLPRMKLHELAAVPWEYFPPVFRDPGQFPFGSPLGGRLRTGYSQAFFRDLAGGDSPRDLVLRGQFSRATPKLMEEHGRWGPLLRREIGDVNAVKEGLEEWKRQAFEAYAAVGPGRDITPELKERLARVWSWKPGAAMSLVYDSAVAEAREPAVIYQLGLCKHEQAVRLQERLALAGRAGVSRPGEAHKVREAWEQAGDWWKQYLADFANRPAAPAVRRRRAAVLLALGDRKGAAALWSDLSGLSYDPQKLARLWLAKQTSAGHTFKVLGFELTA
jgi:hypothetical protein